MRRHEVRDVRKLRPVTPGDLRLLELNRALDVALHLVRRILETEETGK